MSSVKERLKRGKASFGTWQMIGNNTISEVLCQSGFEWVTIDLEHTGISISEALDMIRVIDLCGKVPAVRVSSNDETIIKRVLDSGAKIIIVPMVNSKEEAVKAVNAMNYPPIGTRGVGLARAQEYGTGFEKYKKNFEKQAILIVQIESIHAIDSLEEILLVEGVDGSMIGPYDLSGSLGCPGEFESMEFEAAIKRYEKVSKKVGKAMGYHIVKPDIDKVKEYVGRGYQFIAVGFDAFFLKNACCNIIEKIREEI